MTMEVSYIIYQICDMYSTYIYIYNSTYIYIYIYTHTHTIFLCSMVFKELNSLMFLSGFPQVSSYLVLYTPFAWTKMEPELLTSFKPMAAGLILYKYWEIVGDIARLS